MNRFVRLFLAASVLAVTASLFAADVQGPPAYVDYQGVVLDSSGAVLAPDAANGTPQPINYAMEFRLYDASTGGNIVWAEQQNVTVSSGKFSVQLGKGTPISGVTTQVTTINSAFTGSERYLGVSVKVPPATTAVEIVPRLQFLTSPFTFTADRAHTADNINQTTGTATLTTANLGTATISTGTIANATITGGTISGNGAGLTTLNASNVSAGSLADARLSTNVALLNRNPQTFSGVDTFSAGISMGATTAPLILNDSPIYFRGDNSQYLAYGGTVHPFNGLTIDGPLMVGFAGGTLGTTSGGQKWALAWNTAGTVSINNALFVNNGGASITGGATINGTLTQNGTLNMNGFSIHLANTADYPFYVAGDTFGQIRYINGYDGSKWYQIGIDASSNFSFNPFAGTGSFINRADGSFHINSDVRLKKDIEPLPEVLDRVLRLRPVSYHFKVNEPGTPKSLGFIAQEVETLFPEVVSEGASGYKSMAYTALVPVTVAALQEEHRIAEKREREKDAEIEKLQRQNEALEKRLEAIEARLNKL